MSAYHRALSVGLVCASFAALARAATPTPISAVATVADGAPFTYMRGTAMYTATKGASLIPGDLIESKPNSLVMLEFRRGTAVSAVVAIGPATRAYWIDRPEGATLAVLTYFTTALSLIYS